jgi:hypothetical protein
VSTANELASLFRRDLERLTRQVESFPNDETLWRTRPGVTNAAGSLALHLEGNLREFVGRQLGQIDYERNRELEFSARGLTRQELVIRLTELRSSIPSVIENLSAEQLEAEYPQVVLQTATSTGEFLIHLYGHLNWHLGQLDYLRRILSEAEAS